MSDITLEWFFQIPGLFITIGVLLILIALLVLIIGSSKAKKKQEDLALVDDEVEAVTNSVEPVNVLESNGINYLNGNNGLNSMNNLNNNVVNNGMVNNNTIGVANPMMVNDSINATVGNNSNIAPIVSNPSSVITPVNVNGGVASQSVNFANVENVTEDVNLSSLEPVVPALAQPVGVENNVSTDSLTIQQSVIEPIELGIKTSPVGSINEPAAFAPTVNNEIKREPTVAPIFAESIAPVENVVVQPVQEVQNSNVVNEPVNTVSNVAMTIDNNASGVVPPIVEPAINNSNIVGTELIEPIEPVKQKDLVVDNVAMITPVTPSVNNTVTPASTVENSEVEEIL